MENGVIGYHNVLAGGQVDAVTVVGEPAVVYRTVPDVVQTNTIIVQIIETLPDAVMDPAVPDGELDGGDRRALWVIDLETNMKRDLQTRPTTPKATVSLPTVSGSFS